MYAMRDERGVSLIEVLVALSILSIGLLALAQMQIAAGRVSAAAGRLTRATALAQERVEQLLALPYTDASLVDTTVVGQTTTYTDAAAPQGYTVSWTVDTDSPGAGVKTVNLTVSWRNRGGKAKTFNMAFYKVQ
jgi:type IV pilus assembly protein PilV